MFDIKAIKERGRLAFKANYWPCVLVGLILTIVYAAFGGYSGAQGKEAGEQAARDAANAFNGLTSQEQTAVIAIVLSALAVVSIVLILLEIFLLNPLKVGGCHFFKVNLDDPGTRVGVIKEGFANYGHTFCTMFLSDLFICLWSLLFIIPGFVKMYSYRMVPFLIKDHPELSATETITMSRQMMNGNKWRAFVMDLSFLGWIILSAVTLGLVGLFWTNPYMYSASAALYKELSAGEANAQPVPPVTPEGPTA